MAETLLRHDPIPAEPVRTADTSLSLAPPMTRYSLRARNAEVLEKVVGAALPRKIGNAENNMICLGPDEWLLRSEGQAKAIDGSGQSVSVVDVSERSIGIVIEGPRAAELLLSGNPLDLEKFAVGRATRTIFEGVEIILIRTGEDRFELDVWRSFAPFVWGVLVKAAGEL